MIVKTKHAEIIAVALLCILVISVQIGLQNFAQTNPFETQTGGNVWLGNLLGYDEPQYWSIIKQYSIYGVPYIQDPYGTEKEILFFPYFYMLSFAVSDYSDIVSLWHILKYCHIILAFALMYIIVKKLFPKLVIPFFLLALFSFGFDGINAFSYTYSTIQCGEDKECILNLYSNPLPLGSNPSGDSFFSSFTSPFYSLDYILFFAMIILMFSINKKEDSRAKIGGMFIALFALFSHPYYGAAIYFMYILFLIIKTRKNNAAVNLSLVALSFLLIGLNSLYLAENSPTYSRHSPLAYLQEQGLNAVATFFSNMLRASGLIFLVSISWPFVYYRKKLKSVFNIKKVWNKLNQGNNFIYLAIPASFATSLISNNRLFSHVPLLFSFCLLLSKLKKKQQIIAVIIPILISFPVAVHHFNVVYYDTKYFSGGFKYANPSVIQQLEWLSSVGEPADVIASYINIGLIAPYISGKRVYLGHVELTENQTEKLNSLMNVLVDYYNKTKRDEFLHENNIKYIAFDPRIRLTMLNWATGKSVEELMYSLEDANSVTASYELKDYNNIDGEFAVPIKRSLTFYEVKD